MIEQLSLLPYSMISSRQFILIIRDTHILQEFYVEHIIEDFFCNRNNRNDIGIRRIIGQFLWMTSLLF